MIEGDALSKGRHTVRSDHIVNSRFGPQPFRKNVMRLISYRMFVRHSDPWFRHFFVFEGFSIHLFAGLQPVRVALFDTFTLAPATIVNP